jgi:hypothetical protein
MSPLACFHTAHASATLGLEWDNSILDHVETMLVVDDGFSDDGLSSVSAGPTMAMLV